MFPELLASEYIVIHTHTAFLGLAVVLASILVSRDSEVRNAGFYVPPTAGIGAYLSALIGAKFFWLIEFHGVSKAWRAVLVWEPGYAFYGGLAGVLVFAVIYTRVFRLPFLRLCDLAVPYMAFVEGVTRIGCFLNGCCYGKRCDWPWALSFPRGSNVYGKHMHAGWVSPNEAWSAPVHPAQIYMAVLLFAIWWVLRARWTKRRFDGSLCIEYALVYSVYRFLIEFVRDDTEFPLAGFSVPQMFSAVLFVVAGIVWYVLRNRKQPRPGGPESGNPPH